MESGRCVLCQDGRPSKFFVLFSCCSMPRPSLPPASISCFGTFLNLTFLPPSASLGRQSKLRQSVVLRRTDGEKITAVPSPSPSSSSHMQCSLLLLLLLLLRRRRRRRRWRCPHCAFQSPSLRRRVSDSRVHELYNLQLAAALLPSLLLPADPLGMDGGGFRGRRRGESERGRSLARSVLRSAEFSFHFSSFLHSPLAQSFLWHQITSGTCACVVASRRSAFTPLFLSLTLPPPSSLPRISLVTSLPFPPLSIHDEIRSARNIADSSQNATITPFSAVSEGGTPTKGTV